MAEADAGDGGSGRDLGGGTRGGRLGVGGGGAREVAMFGGHIGVREGTGLVGALEGRRAGESASEEGDETAEEARMTLLGASGEEGLLLPCLPLLLLFEALFGGFQLDLGRRRLLDPVGRRG
jgi:hypothetical protein